MKDLHFLIFVAGWESFVRSENMFVPLINGKLLACVCVLNTTPQITLLVN